MSSPSPAGRPKTRVAILEAARARLASEGYYGMSLEEVAREAGVSRQAVYLHFGSKAKLLTALVQHANDSLEMGERLKEVARASTGEEAMRRWVELNADALPEIHDIVIQLDLVRRSEREVEDVWHIPVDDRRLWCLRVTRRIGREGRLAPGWTANSAADMLWALTMPGVFEDLVIERGWTKAHYVEHVLTVLRRGLLK